MIGTVSKLSAVTLLLTVIVGSYAGSYWYLVKSELGPNFEMVAKYKVGGEVSETIYYPANQMDRYIRPDRWSIGYMLRCSIEKFRHPEVNEPALLV